MRDFWVGQLRVTHPCATPHRNGAFDLHVLSTPPAFTLSQDQTLQKWLISSHQPLRVCSGISVKAGPQPQGLRSLEPWLELICSRRTSSSRVRPLVSGLRKTHCLHSTVKEPGFNQGFSNERPRTKRREVYIPIINLSSLKTRDGDRILCWRSGLDSGSRCFYEISSSQARVQVKKYPERCSQARENRPGHRGIRIYGTLPIDVLQVAASELGVIKSADST
jgi:hypothetical protein